MIPGLDLPPQTYRQRPLFCVVCASNQVPLILNIALFSRLGLILESINGGTQCSSVSSCFQSNLIIVDEVTVRLVIE